MKSVSDSWQIAFCADQDDGAAREVFVSVDDLHPSDQGLMKLFRGFGEVYQQKYSIRSAIIDRPKLYIRN